MDMQGPAKAVAQRYFWTAAVTVRNVLQKRMDFGVRSRAKAVMIQWFLGPVHCFLRHTQISLTHTSGM